MGRSYNTRRYHERKRHSFSEAGVLVVLCFVAIALLVTLAGLFL